METKPAVEVLSALANESRLAVFRLLVKAGPEGVPAGEIAEHLGSAPSTTSFHLAHLARAGLAEARREGRSIVYSLKVEAVRDLLRFVMQDCCQGRPELCSPWSEVTPRCGTCDE